MAVRTSIRKICVIKRSYLIKVLFIYNFFQRRVTSEIEKHFRLLDLFKNNLTFSQIRNNVWWFLTLLSRGCEEQSRRGWTRAVPVRGGGTDRHLSHSSVPRGTGPGLCGLGPRAEAQLCSALHGHEARRSPGPVPAARHIAVALCRRQTHKGAR